MRFHQLDGKDGTADPAEAGQPDDRRGGPLRAARQGLRAEPRPLRGDQARRARAAIEPKKTRTIDIEDFVELEQIDPIYYDHPYYLAPGKGAAKAYALLLEAMEESGSVGIARVVIRSKEQLVAHPPARRRAAMETMLFGDEVIAPDALGELPDADERRGEPSAR